MTYCRLNLEEAETRIRAAVARGGQWERQEIVESPIPLRSRFDVSPEKVIKFVKKMVEDSSSE